jgi:TfoX N-terminal domain
VGRGLHAVPHLLTSIRTSVDPVDQLRQQAADRRTIQLGDGLVLGIPWSACDDVGATSHTGAVAYDEHLAEHVRGVLSGEPGLSEKRMFGGQAFLIDGNLAVSASAKGGLLLRVDPAQTETYVADANACRAVMRGREMDGWLRIRTEGLSDAALERWISRGVSFARSLPAK